MSKPLSPKALVLSVCLVLLQSWLYESKYNPRPPMFFGNFQLRARNRDIPGTGVFFKLVLGRGLIAGGKRLAAVSIPDQRGYSSELPQLPSCQNFNVRRLTWAPSRMGSVLAKHATQRELMFALTIGAARAASAPKICRCGRR